MAGADDTHSVRALRARIKAKQKMTVRVDGQVVHLSGTVGVDWFEDGFTHAQVVTALAGLSGDITVRLNSGGGIASEGAAIHATLTTYDGEVTLIVEGIAASAASLIAMAGDQIIMADGAVMMIHDPLNITIGNSEDHAKTIEQLEAYAISYARVYAKRSGKTADECRDIMKAETWYDGEAAVEAGFADAAGSEKTKAKAAAFDYRVYAHAPKRLAAMAKANDWTFAKSIHNAEDTPAAISNGESSNMTSEQIAALQAQVAELTSAKAKADADLKAATEASATASADAVKADRARRASIMALDEAKGREALADFLYAEGATVERAKATLAVAPIAVEVGEGDGGSAGYEQTRLAGAALNGAGGASAADAARAEAKAGWAKIVARHNQNNK